jgi:hypothetical protein
MAEHGRLNYGAVAARLGSSEGTACEQDQGKPLAGKSTLNRFELPVEGQSCS